MNHNPFLSLIKKIHDGSLKQFNVLARTYAQVTDGEKMDGGNAGMTYERIFYAVSKKMKIRCTFFESDNVVDFFFSDYGAFLQIKTNQGGSNSCVYQFGKTKAKVRGEAVEEAGQKIRNIFDREGYESAENFYLMSYNFRADTLDVYHLAEVKNDRVVIIDDFIHQSPRGFNPDSPVGTELKFSMSVLRQLYRFP